MTNVITPSEKAIEVYEKLNILKGIADIETRKACAKILLNEQSNHSSIHFFPIGNGIWMDKETYYKTAEDEITKL